jgi:pyruvate formate lyase activating enzyme
MTAFPAAATHGTTQLQNGKDGIIFNIKRFAIHDGPGIRTTVFFKGCPLLCHWCHNPESRRSFAEHTIDQTVYHCDPVAQNSDPTLVGRRLSAPEVMHVVEKDAIFYEESNGGVTFSGGEPLQQPEFLLQLLQQSKALGIHTAVDTSGFAASSVIRAILPWSDAFLFDLKLMNDRDHIAYTGVSNRLIFKNLEIIHQAGKDIHLRIPLIPGITDTRDNLGAIAAYLEDQMTPKTIHLLPFNVMAKSKQSKFGSDARIQHYQSQTETRLKRMQDIFNLCRCPVIIGG